MTEFKFGTKREITLSSWEHLTETGQAGALGELIKVFVATQKETEPGAVMGLIIEKAWKAGFYEALEAMERGTQALASASLEEELGKN